MFFIALPQVALTQDFFVPDGAVRQVYDRIEPLPEELNQQALNYQQRRYVIVDGRVMALEDEKPEIPTEQPSLSTPSLPENNAVLPQPLKNTQTAEEALLAETAPLVTTKEPMAKEKDSIDAPSDQLDPSLPAYKNRYALYVSDLKSFQTTGQLPQNEDLNKFLEKMAKPHTETLFQGSL